MRNQADKDYPHKLELSLPRQSTPQYNYKCHLNAAQAVKTGLAVGVIETVIIYKESVVAHYVNLMSDGSIVDFTLGIEIEHEDVRLVRYVHPDEYNNMNDCLWNLKKKLCSCLPWYYRKTVTNLTLIC